MDPAYVSRGAHPLKSVYVMYIHMIGWYLNTWHDGFINRSSVQSIRHCLVHKDVDCGGRSLVVESSDQVPLSSTKECIRLLSYSSNDILVMACLIM